MPCPSLPDPVTFYLDIDGVVTTSDFQASAGKYRLDPAAVGLVAALVREHGAKVVVSSTWRIEDCRPALVQAGLPEDCFHADWRTAIPDASRDPATGVMLPAEHANRGDEIEEHVVRNEIGRYLVLDDVDVGPKHAGHHVRPDASKGLTRQDGALARSLIATMSRPMRGAAARAA